MATAETKKKNKSSEKRVSQYEFCKVCRLNHNQGRRHVYLPNHKRALSSFLSRFQSKLKEGVVFFLKNPIPLRPELAALNRLWCVFCDADIVESGSSFACGNAIAHLASDEHVKAVKNFMFKHGGGIDQVDLFRISESDFAKWEKRCTSLKKSETAVEGSCGAQVGHLNDIHNETNSDYVNIFFNNDDFSHNIDFSFSNGVVPLQNHTNERSQVLLSENGPEYEHSGSNMGALMENDSGSFGNQHLVNSRPGDHPSYNYLTNGNNYPYERIVGDGSCRSTSNGESSSQGSHSLAKISSSSQDVSGGNVHSGAPPPWFSVTDRNELNVHLQPGLSQPVSSLRKQVRSSKLNPKRVGAAWAERRKIELELEKRGKLASNRFDADWLPNFGRVWQSGSRKESRKEFQVENKLPHMVESQEEKSIPLQPYISKRMRRDTGD